MYIITNIYIFVNIHIVNNIDANIPIVTAGRLHHPPHINATAANPGTPYPNPAYLSMVMPDQIGLQFRISVLRVLLPGQQARSYLHPHCTHLSIL